MEDDGWSMLLLLTMKELGVSEEQTTYLSMFVSKGPRNNNFQKVLSRHSDAGRPRYLYQGEVDESGGDG